MSFETDIRYRRSTLGRAAAFPIESVFKIAWLQSHVSALRGPRGCCATQLSLLPEVTISAVVDFVKLSDPTQCEIRFRMTGRRLDAAAAAADVLLLFHLTPVM